MSIAMLCPGCGDKLTAPDHAAGRKVQCPKCQTRMLVPGEVAEEFEVVEDDFEVVEEPLVARRSARKTESDVARRPRRDEDDDRPRRRRDEDDDEFDDRPRRKTKKKKAKKSNNTLLAGIGGTIATIFIIAVVILQFVAVGDKINRRHGGTGLFTPANSTDWVNYSRNGYSGSFPGAAPVHDSVISAQFRREGSSGTVVARRDGSRIYFVYEEMIPVGTPILDRKLALKSIADAMRGLGGAEVRDLGETTVGEFPARNVSMIKDGKATYLRLVIAQSRVLMFGVEGEKSLSESDEGVTRFFNSLQISP